MQNNMTSIALLCILLMERFLAQDMDSITQPVLNGLRGLEKNMLRYTKDFPEKDPGGKSPRPMTRFFLFTPELVSEGRLLDPGGDPDSFRLFNPRAETKVIIHGFLDKIDIAKWMHEMKNEFLLYDDYNVIIVDWSDGNFLPYTTAARNTAKVGEEVSLLVILLCNRFGARPESFHIIGHSLGAHVAGYVGKRIDRLKRITGLDPATYLFSEADSTKKLDRSDAQFVDVIHTDGGGIGMLEPLGHVDFYPNGGEVQPGCTASNSLKTLLQYGVVEGFRNFICSHMRAPHLFTSSINARHCHMVARRCSNIKAYEVGKCGHCGPYGEECANMGYHIDTRRDYGNYSKYFLLTADGHPYCGYEYKLSLSRLNRTIGWPKSDILHVSMYGSNGNAEFQIEEEENKWQKSHVLFSKTKLGDVLGAILRWEKRSLARSRGLAEVVSRVVSKVQRPFIRAITVTPLKIYSMWNPAVFDLCVSPISYGQPEQEGSTFRHEYC